MVELRNAHYRIGDAHLIRGISLTFRPRRFNVILGPNGAGKSTLLKLATGVLRPTEGEVLYGKDRATDIGMAALARRRAVLSQRVDLAFPLPVEDVVMMGRYPHYVRTPSRRDREIVDRSLELVEMSPFRRRSYQTLSGGEQQKVQLARVLAQISTEDAHGEDTYLFLDEPTSNLDVHYELHLLDVARQLLDQRCTVVAILHDINLALRYGDAFVVLENGSVAAEADRAEDIEQALLERVFRVQARRVDDPAAGDAFWRFDSAVARE